MMPDEISPLDLRRDGELFAAMILLAVLAYPESHAGRDRLIEAMKAACIRYARRAGKIDARVGCKILAAMKAQQERATMRRGFSRIVHRLNMAEIYVPNFLESLSTANLQIRAGGSRTQRAGRISGDRRELVRTWSQTVPVLHLAIALRSVVLERKLDFALLLQPDWVRGALLNAEGHVQLLRQMRPFMKTSFVRLVPNC